MPAVGRPWPSDNDDDDQCLTISRVLMTMMTLIFCEDNATKILSGTARVWANETKQPRRFWSRWKIIGKIKETLSCGEGKSTLGQLLTNQIQKITFHIHCDLKELHKQDIQRRHFFVCVCVCVSLSLSKTIAWRWEYIGRDGIYYRVLVSHHFGRCKYTILRGTPVSMTSAVSDAPLTYDDGIQINSRSINAIEPSNILRKFCRAWYYQW